MTIDSISDVTFAWAASRDGIYDKTTFIERRGIASGSVTEESGSDFVSGSIGELGRTAESSSRDTG